jgi:peptide/nickel transport system substrate-binding protein
MLPGNLLMSQDELMWSHTGCLYLMLVYENLVGYPKLEETDAYNFTPKLATAYEVTYESDGTGGQNQIFTYTLREGVKWHDGEAFNAEDVVHTCKYTMFNFAESRPVNWTAVWARDPDAEEILPEEMLVTNTSEYEVQMRYIDGYHQNDSYVPNAYIWYAMTPQHIFQGEDPLLITGNYTGTGPYKVEEFVADSHLLLVRNDDYWGKDDVSGRWQLAGPERVLFQLYEVMGTFWLAFEAGGVSGMDSSASFSIPFEFLDDYTADEDITVEIVDDLSVYYMPFNLHPTGGYAPLADLALRQAIAAAIDKQGIVDVAFGGYAEPQDSFVYIESPMHHDSLPNNTFDLTLAESILTDAGYILYEDGVQVN